MITPTDPPKHFAVKLVKDGPKVPCKVWYSQPTDPDTGELLDRAPRWHVLLGTELVEPYTLLMLVGDVGYIKGDLIDEAEYNHLLAVREWAITSAPSAPEANPRQAIDLMTVAPPF